METASSSTDTELLRAWSGRRCETSFRSLVAKYLGLVHGVALRRTGNASLADEIAQTVFTRLASRAPGINAQPTLAPWLHHCAWCETASALRRESTRRRHMNAYADHLRITQDKGSASTLHAALPHLDDALRTLRGDDQRIVLMRFYEGRGLRDIAAELGKTEAAVRKQGQRALEKMAVRLRRNGAAVSATALAAGLGAVLSQPASAASIAVISTTAAATTGAKLTLLNQVLTLMNTKTKTALITAAFMAVPLVWQWQRASGMEDQLARQSKDAAMLKGRLSLADARNSGPLGRGSRGTVDAGELSGKAAGTAADWEQALKNPDPLQRSQKLAALMSSLTAESAPQVAELFKRLRTENSGNQYEMEHRHFLRAWGRLDGQAALANCASGDGKPNSSSESLAALAGWAQTSPDNARAWLKSQEAGDVKTSLLFGLVDGWSLTNFDAASAFASSQPRSTVRDQFRSLFLQRALAAGGVPEAQRWFDNIPADEHNTLYKQRAFDELIGAMMQRDPAGAAEWITRMGRQNFMSGDGIPVVATRLASSSPGEALRWLESLGMGEGEAAGKTSKGYAQVVDTWSQKDPAAAGTWLQSHGDHPAYDGMAASLSRRVASSDGAAGLDWAASIQDPEQRSNARDDVARTMLRTQGDAARPALAAAGYNEDQISKLANQRHSEVYLSATRALWDASSGQRLDRLKAYELDMEVQLSESRALAAQAEVAAMKAEEARAREVLTRASLDSMRENLAKLQTDVAKVTFSPDGETIVASSRTGVSPNDPGYAKAHPGGTGANCANCHR